jgi:hypothetical protein
MRRQTVKSKVAIIRWIIENQQWILDNRPTHHDVAQKCGQALNIQISHATIGDFARSGELGFEWPTPVANTSGLVRTISYASLCHRVAELEKRLEGLEADLGLKP